MITQEKKQLIEVYNEGLALYKKRKFTEARQKFMDGLKLVPDDGPSQKYIDRCDEYIAHPPGDDWDGVYVMTTK